MCLFYLSALLFLPLHSIEFHFEYLNMIILIVTICRLYLVCALHLYVNIQFAAFFKLILLYMKVYTKISDFYVNDIRNK